jgi:hypothetical protein
VESTVATNGNGGPPKWPARASDEPLSGPFRGPFRATSFPPVSAPNQARPWATRRAREWGISSSRRAGEAPAELTRRPRRSSRGAYVRSPRAQGPPGPKRGTISTIGPLSPHSRAGGPAWGRPPGLAVGCTSITSHACRSPIGGPRGPNRIAAAMDVVTLPHLTTLPRWTTCWACRARVRASLPDRTTPAVLPAWTTPCRCHRRQPVATVDNTAPLPPWTTAVAAVDNSARPEQLLVGGISRNYVPPNQ